MTYNNLSKTVRFVNDNGEALVFDYAGGYLISKPTGIDTLTVSLSESRGIGQIGSTVEAKIIQSRPITISGMVVGGDQSARKNELLAVVRPDIGGKLYVDDYMLDVHVEATPTIEAKNRLAHFQFSVVAPYPYWQHISERETSLFGVAKLFRFPWNLSRPYKFGELARAQFCNVNNSGHVPIPFTVTFAASGAVSNPRVTRVGSNDYLLINKAMVSGERIVVETTHSRTFVTSSIDGDIRGALDLDSTLFRLAVGDNVLKPSADDGLENLDIAIRYAPEIAGVTL